MKLDNTIILWLNSVSFGGLVFLFVCYYYYFEGDNFSLWFINKATASTSIILMGLSFALSGLGYYWDFLDKKVQYRKYLGLVGYFFVAWHGIYSLYVFISSDPDLKSLGLLNKLITFGAGVPSNLSLLMGIASIIIFTLMTVISNNYATKKIGGVLWRKLLRVGYLGLVLALIHFAIRNVDVWIDWVKSGANSLPQLSGLLAIYIIAIIILRIALQISLMRKSPKSQQTEKP